MSKLTNALDRILDWCKQNNLVGPGLLNISSLQPGLSDLEIEEIVKYIPFQLPTEVCELYKWKNGSKNENDLYQSSYIFRANYPYGFYPLQMVVKDAISHYEFCGKWDYLNIFFSITEPSGYVILEENPNKSRVIFCHSGEILGGRPYQYTSLTNMMMTIAECYETGAYYSHFTGDLSNQNLATTKIWWKYNSDIKDILLEELQKTTSEIWRSYEIAQQELIIFFQYSRFVEPLINALQGSLSGDTNIEIIRGIIAAQILGEMGDVRAVEPLIAALQLSENSEIRRYSAQALGMLKDDRAIGRLSA